MTKKRRDKLDIYAEILQYAKDEIKPTRLSFAARLSNVLSERYISVLVERNLLTEIYKGRSAAGKVKITYKTSDEGLEILEMMKTSLLLTGGTHENKT